MHIRSLAFLAALLLLTGRGFADIKWDRPVQQFQRTPADGEIKVRFTFKNTGATPVTIKAGEQYAVAVQPADTVQKESAEISMLTDFPADAPRTYILHARVK